MIKSYAIHTQKYPQEDLKTFWDSLGYDGNIFKNSPCTTKHIIYLRERIYPEYINEAFHERPFNPTTMISEDLDILDYLPYLKLFNTPLKEYLQNKD